jgi:hypothetical protein
VSIYQALRTAYQQIGTAMEPDADPGAIEAALQLAGFQLSLDAGRIIAQRDGQIVPLEPALKTLALKPENASLFVLPVSRVTRLSQLKTAARRSQFISDRGLDEFTRLCGEKK